MIWVTDISGARFCINNDLIERLENVPDTILTLANGRRYVVRESASEIVRLIEGHKRRVHGIRGRHRRRSFRPQVSQPRPEPPAGEV